MSQTPPIEPRSVPTTATILRLFLPLSCSHLLLLLHLPPAQQHRLHPYWPHYSPPCSPLCHPSSHLSAFQTAAQAVVATMRVQQRRWQRLIATVLRLQREPTTRWRRLSHATAPSPEDLAPKCVQREPSRSALIRADE